jgi:hypothetical protein
MIGTDQLDAARTTLRTLRMPGQRRIHFATESERRRRTLLRAMSRLNTSPVIYVARHRNQVAARAAILATMVPQLRSSDIRHVVLESRQEQDQRDRSSIHRAVGSDPAPPFSYDHCPAQGEPLLWVADAVAWAWGRGGRWRAMIADLKLLAAVEEVEVT